MSSILPLSNLINPNPTVLGGTHKYLGNYNGLNTTFQKKKKGQVILCVLPHAYVPLLLWGEDMVLLLVLAG